VCNKSKCIVLILICLLLSACVGKIFGTAVDTSIEVAKVPFKVVGAVVDLAIPDEED